MSERAKRYRAFISYSQKDKVHARRLHRALEAYRLPNGVDAEGVEGRTRKLGRFFRDDDEMGAATDLGAALQGAIADAENLIVVCSPHAAQSRWVNEEIIHFKRTGRADNVFAVIVSGKPHSDDGNECFPPALRFALGTNGTLSDQRVEPLAVDLRKESFARVLTRILAGLAQIPFDALWKREQRRSAAKAVVFSLTLFFITLLVGGSATQGIWYPKVDAYWRYARHAHSTETLMAAVRGATFQDCREGSSDCPVMVVIPQGTFIMGEAPSNVCSDEQFQPQQCPDERRRISIARFAVSQREITFTDWNRCFDAGACGNELPDRAGWAGDSLPVINVSWDDAQKYVAWLSRMTRQDYRLLTEAEWEYASRGVTSADDPRNGDTWSFGNDKSRLSDFAWVDSNQTRPVGTKLANPFGLYDMYGNAWEWVEDCTALVGFPNETVCYLRGGSWGNPEFSSSAFRHGAPPAERTESIGFRVARTL